MNPNSAMSFLDIIVLLAGVYVLFCYYLLVVKKEIREGVLVPKDVDTKKCKDLNGYIKYMGPRTLLLGIMAIASGAIGLYQDYVRLLNPIVYWSFFAAFLAVVFWYAYSSKKALKDYF